MGIFDIKLPVTDDRLDSVAIIMDGNGRWANKRGLPREAGHAAGAKIVEDVLRAFREANIHYVTLYAFSTENWTRPEAEVNALMELFYDYLDRVALDRIKRDDAFCLRFLGDKTRLPEKLRNKCEQIENMAKDRPFVCNVALNYGGRDDVVRAANSALADGNTTLSEDIISKYTYTYPTPDPDLIIRTGGDKRISNFLLWQSAYSELIFLDTLWPDFGRREIATCIREFYGRGRRFGGLNNAK